MGISSNRLAAAVGAGVKNTVFKSTASVLSRKIVIFATPLAAKASNVTYGIPIKVLSPSDVGSQGGFGGMAQRIAKKTFLGSNYSVPIYMVWEEDVSAAVQATGSIVLTASSALAGTIYLYVAGTLYEVAVSKGDTATEIGDAIVSALAADKECPITAVNAAGTLTLTSKSAGPWGNLITVAINQDLASGEALPSGVSITITNMSGGAGLPAFAADLATALGSGSNANEQYFTDLLHGYGQNTTILDALSAYVGEGNESVGCYDHLVHRPFRSLVGDTATGSAALTALLALGAARTEDRCNGVIPRPGSLTHPAEIAAEALGYMAEENNERAEAAYVDLILSYTDPGTIARQAGSDWTTDDDNCEAAVEGGIGWTAVEGGSVKMKNIISFYHPDSIPATSNAYREMRNISITQNILYNKYTTYKADKWTGCTLVKDKAAVTVAASRAKARDTEDIRDTELDLITSFAANAWIYDKQYSIDALKDPDAIQIRTGGDGFTTQVPYIYSGIGNIIDTLSLIDTSVAVVS